MKNKKMIIVLIVFLSVLVVSLTIFMIYMMNGKNKFFLMNLMHKVSDVKVIDEVYDNNFKMIDITSDASDIYIKRSSDNLVRLMVYGDKDRISVNTDNGALEINSKAKKCNFFCVNMTIDKIEVYLPDDYLNEIEIDNKYGDIEIESFKNANIEVHEDCGEVEIEEARQVVVKNNYGDIDIGLIEKAEIEESFGDVTVRRAKDITVKNNYGDIEIKEVTNYLDISDDCGDIEIDRIDVHKNSIIQNNLGNIKIGSTNEIYIDAKTDLGNLKINKNYHKSDITLKIENDCGDIKVNN